MTISYRDIKHTLN